MIEFLAAIIGAISGKLRVINNMHRVRISAPKKMLVMSGCDIDGDMIYFRNGRKYYTAWGKIDVGILEVIPLMFQLWILRFRGINVISVYNGRAPW